MRVIRDLIKDLVENNVPRNDYLNTAMDYFFNGRYPEADNMKVSDTVQALELIKVAVYGKE